MFVILLPTGDWGEVDEDSFATIYEFTPSSLPGYEIDEKMIMRLGQPLADITVEDGQLNIEWTK